MTTSFDVKRINVDMSLLNESQRFAQQIKQIEPILNSSCNKGLSEVVLCNIRTILQGNKCKMSSCRREKRCR
jgi:hypothetical protein